MTDGESELFISGIRALAGLMETHKCNTLAALVRVSPEARRIATDLVWLTEQASSRTGTPLRSDPASGVFRPAA